MPELPEGVGPALRRTATVVVAVALLGLLMVAAVYAVPQLVGGDRSYVVMSGSMEPDISAGDVIVVESVDIAEIRLDDVVTFDRGERFPTTHRVVEIEGTGSEARLVTQGDANEDADPEFIGEAQLVGRVQSVGGYLVVIPAFGHVVQFTNTAGGMVLFVGIPLLLFVLNEVYVRLGRAESTDEPGEPDGTPSHTTATASTHPNTGASGVEIGHLDLSLTLLVLAVLVPYSGLMLLEHRAPLSAMVFAGGAVGLLLVGSIVIRTWLSMRRGKPADPVATTDGGSPAEADESQQPADSRTMDDDQ